MTANSHRAGPRLSVVVPTYGRPERVEALLTGLDRQTLDPSRFEVILVDDGSPAPLAVDGARHRFPLRVLRQENAGPGAARNLGVAQASAPLVLFLNDDALPRPDLLAVHLDAHAAAGADVAVLGAFPFTEASLREPFTRLLDRTDLLFDYQRLRHGERHGWQFFWTCNLSLAREALLAVGGFDAELFREAIVEDVELGYRLARRGVQVLYRKDAICEHDHALTADAFFRRHVRLGVNLARMWRKHGDPRILWEPPDARIDRGYAHAVQARVEADLHRAEQFFATLRQWERQAGGRAIPQAEADELCGYVRLFGMVPFRRGVLLELTGVDPGAVAAAGPAPGKLTSIVICSHDALAKTRACLESLRRTADPDHPTELLVVDNGSTDGSAEWLAAQPDVRLVRNAENAGAPRARNQALALTRGAYVAFLDNDVVVTPGWLERMLCHAEMDASSGFVGAQADRASHGQQVDHEGPKDPGAIAAFAARIAAANHRQARATTTLASFCVLVRRAVLDELGGFDERFSPWGFEDDDLTVRAHLAGYRNKIALDVFVRHDSYAGPKLERHTQLLLRNWRLYCEKWRLGEAPYGDPAALERMFRIPWTRRDLQVPLAPGGAGGPASPAAPAAAAPPPAPPPAPERDGFARDARGKLVEYPPGQGLGPFVRAVLDGDDYPVVFPDVFRPETLVDIGAHVGSAALFFRRAYPGARIVCFEPNPAAFEYLRRNVGGEEGLEIHPLAVGSRDAEMRLFDGVHSTMQASLVPNEENRQSGVTVAVREIRPLLAELGVSRISILKVDTEGMELPILRALGEDLARVDVVYLEYHSEADRRELDALLAASGHVLFAARASEPDRGTFTFVRAGSLEAWRAASRAPRYCWAKRTAAG